MIAFSHQLQVLGRWGYLGAFLLPLLGNATVVVPVPWFLIIASLAAVQPQQAPLYIAVAAVGAAIGETVPYAIGREVAERWSERRLFRWLRTLSKRKQMFVVLATSLSPVMSYPALMAGMLGYPLWAAFALSLVSEAVKLTAAIVLIHFGLHIFGIST